MLFRIHKPREPLSQYIDRFWFYDDFFPSYTRERVLPNGSVELLIELREGPKRLFDPNDASKAQTFRRSWISGVQSRHILIEATRNSSMMGVTFKPGGAYPFFRFPMCDISDSVLELDLIWGPEVHSMRDQILEAPDPCDKFAVLETFLFTKLIESRGDDTVQCSLQEMHGSAGPVSIQHLARSYCVSQTHLNRKFAKCVGVHPKFLARILRFQKALQLLERMEGVHWSHLALDCGYYDQPHFIREFQEFSGYNPTTYLKVRGDYINFIPQSES